MKKELYIGTLIVVFISSIAVEIYGVKNWGWVNISLGQYLVNLIHIAAIWALYELYNKED